MSHQPERTEKTCLNCGSSLYGRFCHVCGQENIIIRQGFWSLTRHFVFDIFHFDGKFFTTLKNILFRPGIISKEYVDGKRARYLDPIRMYLFTSGLFFIIFFSIEGSAIKVNDLFLNRSGRLEVAYALQKESMKHPNDTFLTKKINILLDTSYNILLNTASINSLPDSVIIYRGKKYIMNYFKTDSAKFEVLHKKKSWLSKLINARAKKLREEWRDNPGEVNSRMLESFLHKLPYLLFDSLPLFAGVLNLLYVRRKKYCYSDHVIFTLHHYILSFILMLMAFLMIYLSHITLWAIWRWLQVVIIFLWVIYLYLEMKRFYQQGTMKTIIKLILLSFLMVIVLLILFTLFFIFSIFQG